MRLAWTERAKVDLVEIRRYSIARWGRGVASAYLADLAGAAREAAAHPGSLRMVQGPFRIRRAGSHYLLIHVDPEAGRLTVARVLHVRMDVERHLPPAGTVTKT